MRNPLKERKRFRAPPKALPPLSRNNDNTLNVLSPSASPRSAKNDYLDLSGQLAFLRIMEALKI